jgi:AraC-like DNA-binding protein/mannose-6-phosphate isomerase-like protein (cupin superfamily)
MNTPKFQLGYSTLPEGKEIVVKDAVYSNETQLERNLPHRHSFYVICLIRSGSGIHVIDFEEFEVRPNRLFIINPGQVHFWKIHSDTNISMVQFSESVPDLNSFLWIKRKYLDLAGKQCEAILELSSKLKLESDEKDSFSRNNIRSYLAILCRTIARMSGNINNSVLNQKEDKLYKFSVLVDKYYIQQKSVRFYAGKLNISANYLNMLSGEILGKNAGDIITQRTLLEAKRLLYHTNLDINQVAFELGFDDPSYFTRFFRKHEKCTPSTFREMIYKKYQYPNE